jgi:hypothetical protein
VNLTGATILGTVRRWSDRAIVDSAGASIVGAAVDGNVSLPLSSMVATSPGLHSVEWRVTIGASQTTYPSALDPDWLLMLAPGGATVVPLPDPGAPVFVADTATGGPTVNGQTVFAGRASTISIPTGVTWFQLAVNPNGTPWETGATPTLVQAGSTAAAEVPAALLASGGNLVLITRVGTVLTAATTGRASIWAWTGTAYAPDPDARLFEQATGDPAPTGLDAHDIVVRQN